VVREWTIYIIISSIANESVKNEQIQEYLFIIHCICLLQYYLILHLYFYITAAPTLQIYIFFIIYNMCKIIKYKSSRLCHMILSLFPINKYFYNIFVFCLWNKKNILRSILYIIIKDPSFQFISNVIVNVCRWLKVCVPLLKKKINFVYPIFYHW
jgi:hypothetical protein